MPERNSNPSIYDIRDDDLFEETCEKMNMIRNSCNAVLMIMDNKPLHKLTMTDIADIRQHITDAHWNVNSSYKPLHEISKGRL